MSAAAPPACGTEAIDAARSSLDGERCSIPAHEILGCSGLAGGFRCGTPSAESELRMPAGRRPMSDRDDFVAQVDGRDGQIVALRHRDLLEPAEIAERLEMKPNAVYQALHRALARLEELDHA